MEVGCGDALGHRHHRLLGQMKGLVPVGMALVNAPMKRAYSQAEIPAVLFHELRHTYASGLINIGVSLKIIADQLGHADTRMVEEHYGHLCQDAKRDKIRSLSPVLGIGVAKVPEPTKKLVIPQSEYSLWRQPGVPLPANIRLVKG